MKHFCKSKPELKSLRKFTAIVLKDMYLIYENKCSIMKSWRLFSVSEERKHRIKFAASLVTMKLESIPVEILFNQDLLDKIILIFSCEIIYKYYTHLPEIQVHVSLDRNLLVLDSIVP